MVFNILTASAKMFALESEGPQFPTGSGNFAYGIVMSHIHKTFSKGQKIYPKDIIRWVTESSELREFFTFVEACLTKIT